VARPKEFDPDIALQEAMKLFWQRGYEATSMAQLTEALGIGRASLYATFGDKHQLYLKALDRWIKSRDPSPIELLSRPGPALAAVRTLVEAYVEESIEDEQRRGCMVVNSATELCPHNQSVSRLIALNWEALEGALASALTRAQAQGELAARKDPLALARFLFVFLQGVRVIAKGDPDPGRLRDAAAQALATIEE
jgi:TetR/AcrR family transcriptional regulator, transcriptional repressor for nem operon